MGQLVSFADVIFVTDDFSDFQYDSIVYARKAK